jgi:hypothetical protein
MIANVSSCYFLLCMRTLVRYIRTLYCVFPFHDVYFPFSKRELLRFDRLVRELFLPRSPTKFPEDVILLTMASQNILESLESERSPRAWIHPALIPTSAPKPVREARA